MASPPPLKVFDIASALAPTNIAVVKYWGKDQARGGNTPINSSASLTLDPADLRAETVMVASPALKADELYLNGRQVDVRGDGTHAKRLRRCLATMRRRCARGALPRGSAAASPEELATWGVRVVSRNTFPTAAGLASSAAGYAALVKCAAELYGVADAPAFSLSATAREGSGSACRSLDGGLVAWRKGCRADRADSKAEQLFDERHWPALRAVIIVASAVEKETPSTEGMQRSVATSPFLAHRAESVAEPRLAELARAFKRRDFAKFGELTMRDSNSFHATCLDTFPPIFYLTEVSRRAIRCVDAFNEREGRIRAAYTFDAGPNAVVFCEDAAVADAFAALAATCFLDAGLTERGLRGVTNAPAALAEACRAYAPDPALLAACGPPRGGAHMMYLTRVGGGAAAPLADSARDALVDAATGAPRARGAEAWQKGAPAAASPPLLRVAAAVAALFVGAALSARRK
jgi:diphosphomevalonate decarboxylase